MGQAVPVLSEIRTGDKKRAETSKDTQHLPTLKRLEEELDREWFALKRKRHEVGRILSQIERVLAAEGAFSEFLRDKRIPRSTAYDLISDYKRWTKLPAPLQQAAERHEVDLSERKFVPFIKRQIEGLDPKDIEAKADNLVLRIDQAAKRSHHEPIELAALEGQRRSLMKAFEALHALIGAELPRNRPARLSELLSYAVYSYGLDPQKLKVKSEPPPSWLFTGVGEDRDK